MPFAKRSGREKYICTNKIIEGPDNLTCHFLLQLLGKISDGVGGGGGGGGSPPFPVCLSCKTVGNDGNDKRVMKSMKHDEITRDVKVMKQIMNNAKKT